MRGFSLQRQRNLGCLLLDDGIEAEEDLDISAPSDLCSHSPQMAELDEEPVILFDDRLEKVVSLKIEHSITVPDRGAIKGRKTKLELEAKDIEVRRVYARTISCRTAAPENHISSIKHTSRKGRWTTALGKVATRKVGWLELTFDETRPRRRP